MRPKRILFTFTVLLVVFSFNLSYSQDVSIDKTLKELEKKFESNLKELKVISNDLIGIGKSLKRIKPRFDRVIYFSDKIEDAKLVYEYQLKLIYARTYVDEVYQKKFYFFIVESLNISKVELELCFEEIQANYPFI